MYFCLEVRVVKYTHHSTRNVLKPKPHIISVINIVVISFSTVISTTLKFGTRTDRAQKMEDKVKSVEEKLEG